MATAELGEVSIHYQIAGDAGLPVLVLSHALGVNMAMWEPQVEAFSVHFRLLSYDVRGHGQSSIPSGPYSVEDLGRDVLKLLDALEIQQVSFCGVSMGGLIGQWLGIHAPERIDRLILSNTSAYLGPADQFDGRITSVLKADPSETAEMFLRNWFPSNLLRADGPMIAKIREVLLATDPQGFAGSYAAVRDMDLRRPIALISSPTLVIAGQYDTVTLASHSDLIATTVPGARLVTLPVVHLSNLELPDVFTRTTLEFLLLKGRTRKGQVNRERPRS